MSLTKEYTDVQGNVLGVYNSKFSMLVEILCKSIDYPNSEELKLTSSFHDIGKHSIPKHILFKPGSLTSIEFEVVKMHTVLGSAILESEDDVFQSQLQTLTSTLNLPVEVINNPYLRKKAASIALHHHEKWDGTGYPHGLKENDIPLEVQLISIADVIDALFSQRPYKEPWDSNRVFNYLEDNSGVMFSPKLVASISKYYPQISLIYR